MVYIEILHLTHWSEWKVQPCVSVWEANDIQCLSSSLGM